MKTSRWNWLGSIPARCAFLPILHAFLQGWLAQRDVVAVIFSGGGTAPAWMLAATALFAGIRLLAFFWVPAALVFWAVRHLAGGAKPRV
jgi:hypothetical protein